MKKSIKIISILMIVAMILMVSTSVFAAVDYSNIIKNVEDNSAGAVSNDASEVAGTILRYAQWVAIVGSVIVITILGIKYMMGSLEEKAAYKKSMIPLVVGCVIAIGATSIAKFLFSIF